MRSCLRPDVNVRSIVWRLIHDGNIIPIKQLSGYDFGCFALGCCFAPDFIATAPLSVEFFKPSVFLENMIAERMWRGTAEFAVQQAVGHPNMELKCGLARVEKPEIDVVIEQGCPRAIGNDAALIWKGIKAVACTGRDMQGRVQGNPMQKIADLTEPAARAANRFAVGKLHAFAISFVFCGSANQAPEGKGFPRPDQHMVQMWECQAVIVNFVVLPFPVLVIFA